MKSCVSLNEPFIALETHYKCVRFYIQQDKKITSFDE
jgi:hypothetical protein